MLLMSVCIGRISIVLLFLAGASVDQLSVVFVIGRLLVFSRSEACVLCVGVVHHVIALHHAEVIKLSCSIKSSAVV